MLTPKKAPYADTEVGIEQSMMEINKLLKAYGINNYVWTTLWGENIVSLKFALEVKPGKYVPIRMTPPMFLAKRKNWNAKHNKYDIVDLPNWAQSLRLLFWLLKTKLEAIAYGFREVQEEFMGDILVRLPDGREGTMSEAMKQQLPYSKGTEPLELGQGGVR